MLRHRVPGLRVLAVTLATTVAVSTTAASAAPAKQATADEPATQATAVTPAIAEHEAARADGEDQADDPSQPPEPTPSASEPVADEPAPGRRGLVIAGAAAALLGAVGLGVMAGGIGMGARANDFSRLEPDDLEGRRAQLDRGRTGDMIAIIGGATAGALLISSAVLLGLGLRHGSPKRTVAVRPAVGAGRAGVALQGRF